MHPFLKVQKVELMVFEYHRGLVVKKSPQSWEVNRGVNPVFCTLRILLDHNQYKHNTAPKGIPFPTNVSEQRDSQHQHHHKPDYRLCQHQMRFVPIFL